MPARGSADAFSFPNYQNDHYTDIETVGRAKARQKGGKDRGKPESFWVALEAEKSLKKSSKQNASTTLGATSKKSKQRKSFEQLDAGGLLSAESFVNNPLLENELKNWTLPRVELWCRDPDCSFNQQIWGHQHLSNEHSGNYSSGSSSNNQVPNYQTIPAITIREPEPPPQPQQRVSLTRSRLSASAELLSASSEAQVHRDIDHHNHHHTIYNNEHSSSMYQINRLDGQQNKNTPHYHSISSTMGLNTNRHQNHPHSHRQTNHATSNSRPQQHVGMNNLNSKKRTERSMDRSEQCNFPGKSSSTVVLSSSQTTTPSDTSLTTPSTSAHSGTTMSRSQNTTTNSTILTINSSIASPAASGDESTTSLATDVSSGSTFVTGFESSTSSSSNATINGSSSKPMGHDIQDHRTAGNNSTGPVVAVRSSNTNNGLPSVYQTASSSGAGGYVSSLPYSQGFRTPSAASSHPFCPNCSGVVPINHLDNTVVVPDSGRLKGDPSFWSFNKFQHPLQRDHSFHSVGGFTLNGQYNTNVKKHTMLKFCSSHKISLVVSTFSLLVTIGLLITLFLMKQRGMMNTMDSMDTRNS